MKKINKKEGLSANASFALVIFVVILLAAVCLFFSVLNTRTYFSAECEFNEWRQLEGNETILGKEFSIIPVHSHCKLSAKAPLWVFGGLR
jgi:hypothetical protein